MCVCACACVCVSVCVCVRARVCGALDVQESHMCISCPQFGSLQSPMESLGCTEKDSEDDVAPCEQFSATPRLEEISDDEDKEQIYWEPPDTEQEIYETLQRKRYSVIAESDVK